MTGDQLTLADALKADGMARADAATDQWWRDCADRAIREAARTGLPFQSWDLVQRYGLPEPREPRLGAAVRRCCPRWGYRARRLRQERPSEHPPVGAVAVGRGERVTRRRKVPLTCGNAVNSGCSDDGAGGAGNAPRLLRDSPSDSSGRRPPVAEIVTHRRVRTS